MKTRHIKPVCPLFGQCGGCQYQDIPYEEELSLKEEFLKEALGASLLIDGLSIRSVIPSPKVLHYRNRLDLKLSKDRNGVVRIGFSPGVEGPVVEVSACPIAMDQISSFIPKLKEEAVSRLPRDYRMANLTVRCGDGEDVNWGGIGRKSLRMFERDYFFTEVAGKRIFYSLDTFFQANLSVLPKIADVIRSLDILEKDAIFFDLYGGVGFFGLIVQDLVKRVVHIEENVHSVKLAAYNTKANNIWNMEVHEGRVEDVLPRILLSMNVKSGIVMVDPPRAGLGVQMAGFLNGLKDVQSLLYLSCSPESLAVDLAALTGGGWKVELIQPFDFFPRTRHVETLVLLRRE